MKILYTILILSYYMITAQEVIAPGVTKNNLFNFLNANYKTSTTLGYNNARDIMYSLIDIEQDNILKGIYTNYSITLNIDLDPSTNAYDQGLNCEHSWPQSMGAGQEPQKSDMHHLYPCKSNVNSSRGNKPFGESIDSQTSTWYRNEYSQTSIPSQYIDEFSETNNSSDVFEPREIVKGNIARSMYYFHTMYNNNSDQSFFELQKDVLYQWHLIDPVDQKELDRTWAIAQYQDGKPNPYVIDNSLIYRIWFFNCFNEVNYENISTNIRLNENYVNNLDLNSDSTINIVDLLHGIDISAGLNGYFTCD